MGRRQTCSFKAELSSEPSFIWNRLQFQLRKKARCLSEAFNESVLFHTSVTTQRRNDFFSVMKRLVESRLLIFTALQLLQSQTASVMAKPKMTQRSKRMHDEKFVQELFEETIHRGSGDYSLSCVDIMIKGTWPMEFKSSSACWGKNRTGEWFLRKYNDFCSIYIGPEVQWESKLFSFNSTEAQKDKQR